MSWLADRYTEIMAGIMADRWIDIYTEIMAGVMA